MPVSSHNAAGSTGSRIAAYNEVKRNIQNELVVINSFIRGLEDEIKIIRNQLDQVRPTNDQVAINDLNVSLQTKQLEQIEYLQQYLDVQRRLNNLTI